MLGKKSNPYGLQSGGGSYVNPYIKHLRKCKKKYPLACAYPSDLKKKRECIKEYVRVQPKKEQPKKEQKKDEPKKEPKEPEPVPTPAATPKATTKATKKKEQPKKEDQIIKELREYIVKHNPNFSEQDLDEAVEEILEKGYRKKYKKNKGHVGDAIYDAFMPSDDEEDDEEDDEGDEEDEPKMLSMPGSLIKDMLPDKEGNIMSYKDFYEKFKLDNEGMTTSQLRKKSKEIYDSLVKGVKKSKVTKKKEEPKMKTLTLIISRCNKVLRVSASRGRAKGKITLEPTDFYDVRAKKPNKDDFGRIISGKFIDSVTFDGKPSQTQIISFIRKKNKYNKVHMEANTYHYSASGTCGDVSQYQENVKGKWDGTGPDPNTEHSFYINEPEPKKKNQ